ncbi:hypothetical protein RchiOBHm_Chr6g0305611 [Rosa chinensis]|uniref:Uncharacterized protein n=1 Tax=Rosa chinensis TaxID=74649 RepID=A0A2P6PZX4_ROSCH|nr:hypothetical protein RchiOBHm_Chr6g0305611 [Rosa chinensis]
MLLSGSLLNRGGSRFSRGVRAGRIVQGWWVSSKAFATCGSRGFVKGFSEPVTAAWLWRFLGGLVWRRGFGSLV